MMKLLARPGVAQTAAALAAVYALYYLTWRATSTLNPDAFVLSLVLLAAETQGVLNLTLFMIMAWDVDRTAPFQLRPGLKVDVYVPTYDEDLHILEATLTGCQAMAYPHRTYVLDDGRRPEVRALAGRLGCRYLTRPDNRHAKAGNLNAALARTKGDFIVVVDADTVPQPDFLDRTLGYFTDERVAVVQVPQEFYNLDSVQHASRGSGEEDWHEQTLFYRVIQAGKNRWNAAFWCGSPSVLRRAALESVGGVATETVTEDLHTSIRLHARGWKTVYHNEALAFGIAPQTLHAFALQRLRWSQGTMQILRSRDNPLWARGLTVAQRLNYLGSMITYFEAYELLILLTMPAVVLLTGLLPIDVSAQGFLVRWVPHFLLGALANAALGRGYFRYLRLQEYNLLKLFTFIWASTVLIWPRSLRFRVTPKRADASVWRRERLLIAPHLGVMALTGLAVVLGVVNLWLGVTASYTDRGIVVLTLFWALANVGLLALGIRHVLRRLYHRQAYRFPMRVKARLYYGMSGAVPVVTEDISLSGVGVVTCTPVPVGQQVSLWLDLPDGPLRLHGHVVYRRTAGPGEYRAGVRLSEPDQAARRRLFLFLFVTLPGYRRDAEAASVPAPVPAIRERKAS